MCKKPCKECPWTNSNSYSLKFRTYVDKMSTINKNKHACHMITKDIWGYKEDINDKNICQGYKKFNT